MRIFKSGMRAGTDKYDDANVLIAQIEDYFTDRGGTCKTKIEDEPQTAQAENQ